MNRKRALAGWGNFPIIEAEEFFPFRQKDYENFKKPYHPRGLGRSYGDASLPDEERYSLNTRYLDHFINFDERTNILEAEAGVSFEQILRHFIPKGYFLPVTPGTKYVTLGGAIASNVHGKNHHHDGSIENFIVDFELLTPTGLYRCSPTENEELFRATLSGYGLTGLITKARLKLIPIESSFFKTKKVTAHNLKELFELFAEYDEAYQFSVAWMDTLAVGADLGRSILMLGNYATLDDLPEENRANPLIFSDKFKITFPTYLPSATLNKFFLKNFNTFLFHFYDWQEGEHIELYEPFFYPLDMLRQWNKMYGRQGFLQYQCAIPDPDGEEGVRAVLQFLSSKGMGSFLSVLKRCGDDHPMIAFAKKGYTLALDIPLRSDTLAALDELDRIVLDFGGRLYLTKDARLSPSTFRAMYPNYEAWLEVIEKYNPQRTIWSAMANRLKL